MANKQPVDVKKENTTKGETARMSSTKKESLSIKGVKIISVTSPNMIAQIAEAHSLNPQEVFVRVKFEYEGTEYQGSNQLRFFGKDGYAKLIKSRDEELPVNITITKDIKGYLMYLDPDTDITIDDLFKDPVEKEDTRKDLSTLF